MSKRYCSICEDEVNLHAGTEAAAAYLKIVCQECAEHLVANTGGSFSNDGKFIQTGDKGAQASVPNNSNQNS